MPRDDKRELKPYYNLNEIDKMIHNVVSYNKDVPILYSELKHTFKDSKIFIEQLKLVQTRNRLPKLPTEILSYIIELKYNLDDMNDLGVLLSYNDMVKSYKKEGSEFLYGYFRFIDAEDITKLDKTLYYFDIATKYIGMGHVITLSIDKTRNKFFFKYGGGSSYFDYEETFNKTQKLYTLDKYKNNLFSIKDIYSKMEIDRDYTSQKDDEYSPQTSIQDCIVDSYSE
jgi:hypothetical protein